MVSSKQENGVLKLVHPGGLVEVHTEPITAAEVMKKNPRHCVTRPDVFKFPWIVVRPDSVLKLGTVFFILPNHTLHRLMRNAAGRRQPSSLLRGHKQQSRVENCIDLPPDLEQSFESLDDAAPKPREHGRVKQSFPVRCSAEARPKHSDQRSKKQSLNKPSIDMSLLQVSCMNFKQPSRVESIKKTHLLQDRSQHRKRQSPGKRSKESKERSRDKSHDVCNEKGAVVVRQPPKQDLLLLKLKSCLRNPEDKDRRRSHGLKVTFLLPKEDKKEHSKCYYEPPVLTDELFKLRIQ